MPDLLICRRLRRSLLVMLAAAAAALPAQALAQTDSSAPATERSPVAAILVTEAFAFGTAALSRSEQGARAVGAIDGVSGLAMLGIAAFTDRQTGWPEFGVPYGVGLLALSYYNFDQASSANGERRFWTNAIGINATVLIAALHAKSAAPDAKPGALTLRLTPSTLHVSLRF